MHTLVGDEMDLGSLRLLASAVARRPMEVAAATHGDRSWTDGKTMFLEGTVNPGNQIRMLAVQGSLVASGSLDPEILRQLVRRPGLTRRYLAVEGHRALLANEHVLPPWVCSLIDRELASSCSSVEESLDWARGRNAIGEVPLVFGAIDVKRSLASMHRGAEIHLGRPLDVRPRGKHRALTDLDSDEYDQVAIGDLLLSPVGGGSPVGRLLQKMFRPVRRGTGGGPVGADSPTHSSSARPGSRGYASAVMSSIGEREVAPEVGHASTSTVYPEWDGSRRRYRPEWCTVIESDARADVASRMQLPSGLAVRRSLASLGTGMIRCRRQPQGDDIDIDAAVEAHIDTLAGRPHGDDAYVASRRWRRDLGVLVLLDVSGSVGEPGATGRSVHEEQRLAAVTITTALHDLGDRVALYAFNSRGRQAVQVLRVKGFDDRLDVQVTRRPRVWNPGHTPGWVPPSVTAPRSWSGGAGTPGACWWSSRMAWPMTTAIRGATAKPMHVGL